MFISHFNFCNSVLNKDLFFLCKISTRAVIFLPFPSQTPARQTYRLWSPSPGSMAPASMVAWRPSSLVGRSPLFPAGCLQVGVWLQVSLRLCCLVGAQERGGETRRFTFWTNTWVSESHPHHSRNINMTFSWPDLACGAANLTEWRTACLSPAWMPVHLYSLCCGLTVNRGQNYAATSVISIVLLHA